jgi:peptide/nickel transport system ATP-binding protein
MSEDKQLISIKDLSVCYDNSDGTVYAVNDVSFDLNEGETLGLVGETGAGKTTIAKAILQILNPVTSDIKSGEILYHGEDLLKKTVREMEKVRGNEITMIFQDPMTALNPVMTVGEQIAEGGGAAQRPQAPRTRAGAPRRCWRWWASPPPATANIRTSFPAA